MEPTTPVEPARPYGFSVTLEYALPGGGMSPTYAETTIRRKGTEQSARRAATLVRGFSRILSCTPITADQAPVRRKQHHKPSPSVSPDSAYAAIQQVREAAAELAASAERRRVLVETIAERVAFLESVFPTPPGVENALQPARIANRCDRLKELFNMEELASWRITIERIMTDVWQRLPQ